MRYNYVAFDLDGTLTDPFQGITNSLIYAFQKMDKEVPERAELSKMIGPPLSESFPMYYGFTDAETDTAIKHFQTYFKDQGLYENVLFPGVKEMLEALTARGIKVLLATSKPEVFGREILCHFGIDGYFTYAGGGSMDESFVKKGAILNYVIEKSGAEKRCDVVMVGDRCHDLIGARENGVDGIGVLFGYGSREELEKENPVYIAENMEMLKNYLLGCDA